MGAGCASLSLLMRMIQRGKFGDKKILLIDKEPKINNDRTWCFWEKSNGFFEDIVYKKWDTVSFLSDDYSSAMNIAPYQYKMIRGIDFYDHCFSKINKQANVEVTYGHIHSIIKKGESLLVGIDEFEFNTGDAIVFNSIYEPATVSNNSIKLLQHFKGWIIRTAKPLFDPQKAIMMDFRVHQSYGTTFAYVLPLTENTALVEYTLFTKDLLTADQYRDELKDYLHQFHEINSYVIEEEEFGVIPMTNEKFTFKAKGWQIGTAGGQTKASSGYTFQFIQKQSEQILNQLIAGKSLSLIPATAKRFSFYDNTLLHILYHNKLPGDKIFAQLFKKNKPQQVLRFLDNETSLKEELKIISTLPTLPFLKAALRQF